MLVLAEGLQTQGRHFILEEEIGCLTLDADEVRDEKGIVKVSHGIACPNALYIIVSQ